MWVRLKASMNNVNMINVLYKLEAGRGDAHPEFLLLQPHLDRVVLKIFDVFCQDAVDLLKGNEV